MRTNHEPPPASPNRSRERRAELTDGPCGELDRRGLHLALTDALADILRWEAAVSRTARH